MEISFSKHPFLDIPSDEDILLLAKNDPKLLSDMHRLHEKRIEDSIIDPYIMDLTSMAGIVFVRA